MDSNHSGPSTSLIGWWLDSFGGGIVNHRVWVNPLLLVLCVLFALPAACRHRNQKNTSPIHANLPRNFSLVWQEPATLDPACVDDAHGGNIVCQIFDGLVALDSHLNLTPELARSWKISRDGRIYTFELEPSARFHDGRLITAGDFVFSFTRLFGNECGTASIGAEYLKDVVGISEYLHGQSKQVRGLQAPDPLHFVIQLRSPNTAFLSILAMPNFKVVPKEAMGPDFSRHPIGSGPFIFVEWKAGYVIRLSANPNYYRGQPKLHDINFLLSDGASPREELGLLFENKIQMIRAIGDDPAVVKERGFQAIKHSELSIHYLGFNVKMPPFNDIRVRKAIACSIKYDRFSVLDPLTYTPATGIVPFGMPGYSGRSRPYAYDSVAAAKLLMEAGYKDGHMNQDMDFPSYATDDGIGARTETIIAEDLSKIGLRLRKRYIPWTEYNKALTERKLPIFRLAWAADVPNASYFLHSLFYSNAYNNMFAFNDPRLDRMLDMAIIESGSSHQKELCGEIEREILNQVPLIPLDFGCQFYALQPYVRGLDLNPYGIGDMPLDRVWYEW